MLLLVGALGIVAGTARVVMADDDEFEESDELIRQHWESAMTPEQYRAALAETGMAEAIAGGPERGTAWMPIGPTGRVANFDNPSQAFIGRISGIEVRTNGPAYYVYAGACSGGLWLSSSLSGVGVWTSLGNTLPNPSVRAFAVNPTNRNDIIVGTGDLNRYGGAGMYRTTNAGATWSQVTLPVTASWFGRILWSPTDPNVIVASCANGLVVSTDGGAHWLRQIAGGVTDVVAEPGNFNILYACTNYLGVYKSTDGGTTWSPLNLQLPPGVAFTHAYVAVCRDAPQNVAVFLSQSDYQVLRSRDRGASWTNITGTLGGWHMNEFGHTGAIAIRPNNPDEIYVGARGFLKTSNDGATWDSVVDTHADITELYFGQATGDNVLWITMDGGIIAQTLGGGTQNWNGNAVSGLRCTQVDFLDAQRDIRTVGAQDTGSHYTIDRGATWTNAVDGDGLDCEIVNDLSLEYWYSSGVFPAPTKRVFRKTLGATAQYTNNTADSMDGLFYDRYSHRLYSIGIDDLIYSADVTAGTPSWIVEGSVPANLAIRQTPTGSCVDGRTMYANTADPSGQSPVPVVAIMRRSGSTWSVQTYDCGGSGGVQSIYASTENAGEAWVTMARDGTGEPLIFHSADYGASWSDVSGNLTSLKYVRCIVNKPFERDVLYAGTEIGVFATSDGGMTWQPFQAGLPIVTCTDLRYVVDVTHGGNDTLVAATYGHGVYERSIASFPIVYVQRLSPSASVDGSYEHPYHTFADGRTAVPSGGSLALYGDTYQTGHLVINTPMTLRAYGGVARIQ